MDIWFCYYAQSSTFAMEKARSVDGKEHSTNIFEIYSSKDKI
jgi:hypothetical protein